MARQISVSIRVRGIKTTDVVRKLKDAHHTLALVDLQVLHNERTGFIEVKALGGHELPEGARYTLQSILAPYEVAAPQMASASLKPSKTAKQIVSAMAGRRRMPIGF